jgi:ABC-type glutathione transport system ATPase component
MPKIRPSLDLIKQFAALEKKASKQVLKTKAAIEKKIARELAFVHKKYAKELKEVDSLLARFGLSTTAPKAATKKAAPAGKRTRLLLPKLSDEEIKAQLSKVLSGGKKVSSAVIFKEVGLARPRFTAFLKAHKGFLHIEGNKRSTTYSLKG